MGSGATSDGVHTYRLNFQEQQRSIKTHVDGEWILMVVLAVTPQLCQPLYTILVNDVMVQSVWQMWGK